MGTTESIAVRGPPDPQPPRAEIHRSFLSCDPTCCDLPFCVTWILIRSPPRRSAPSNFLCLPPLVPNFPSMDSVYFRHKHHSHWNVLEKLHWFWNLSLSNISRIHTQTHIYPSAVPLQSCLNAWYYHSHPFGSKNWRDYNQTILISGQPNLLGENQLTLHTWNSLGKDGSWTRWILIRKC